MITDQTIHDITEILMPLIGKLVGSTNFDDDRDLGLSFAPADDIGDDIALELESSWLLWIFSSAWSIENEQDVLVASEDSSDKINQVIEELENERLQSFEVMPPAFETVLTFSHNLVLRIFPWTSEKYHYWKLRTPEMKVLTIGPGDEWSYKEVPKK